METIKFSNPEQEPMQIKNLSEFDLNYFKELEGDNGWLALGSTDYTNSQYFTVYGEHNEKLGIVGVFDTEEEKNVTHTVVDPKYRGQGLAAKFKDEIMDKLNLPYITLTISLDNIASIHATEKLPGVKKVSDEQYEKDFYKVKYIYERSQKNN